MFTLKTLSPMAIPAALEKANRYRLLNEPEQAESICKDILAIDPKNAEALKTMILAMTDQLASMRCVPIRQIRELLPQLPGEYERSYYAGIIDEREGIAWMRSDKPRAGVEAYHCFRQAMMHFERAETLRPKGNDDAILRWNSCARMIDEHKDVAPADDKDEGQIVQGD